MPDDTSGPSDESAPSEVSLPPAASAAHPSDLNEADPIDSAAPEGPTPPPPPYHQPPGPPPGSPWPPAPDPGAAPLPGYPPPPAYASGPGYPPAPGYPPIPGQPSAGTPPSGWAAPPHPGFPVPGQPTGVLQRGSNEPFSDAKERPRRTKRIAVAVGLAVLILIGVGVTLIATSGSSNVPAVSPAAKQLVSAALKSTIDGGSFHYVSRFTSQGQTQTTVGDAGASSGKQVITIGSDTFTVLVIGTSCYFQGDERQMVEELGLPTSIASTHAGQWISLSPGDPPYQSVYVAVTTHSALYSNIAFAPHQESGTTTRAGFRVIGVTGPMTNQVVNGQTQRATGTANLYVTTSHPHLPVEYTEDGKIDKVPSKLLITFSKWGEVVAVSAPHGAVTYSSLGTGNGTPPTTEPPVLTSASS